MNSNVKSDEIKTVKNPKTLVRNPGWCVNSLWGRHAKWGESTNFGAKRFFTVFAVKKHSFEDSASPSKWLWSLLKLDHLLPKVLPLFFRCIHIINFNDKELQCRFMIIADKFRLNPAKANHDHILVYYVVPGWPVALQGACSLVWSAAPASAWWEWWRSPPAWSSGTVLKADRGDRRRPS